MRWPLRRQIMLPMAAIMLLTVVVLAGVGALLSVRATKAHIATRIESVAQILERSNFPLTDTVLRQMQGLSGAEMAVVDRRGRILSASGPPSDFVELIAAAPQASDTSFELGDRQWVPNKGYFHTVVPLGQRRGQDSAAALHIFYPEADFRRAWQHAIYPSLAFIFVAFPVVMLLARTTASRISQRVSQLQGQVDRIACGDFHQLALAERDDEIRALGRAVNRMATMLAHYEVDVRSTERMRTLAHLGGGIAHQLRNSATGCGIALDLHAEECPIGVNCESLDVARRQLRLMEEYIQRFLQLGKPTGSQDQSRIDLGTLIDNLLPLVRPAARHARVQLEWTRPDDSLAVTGDTPGLSQLLINLFVNAIEAAGQGAVRSETPGRVTIALSRCAADQIALTVCDSGPGPPEEIGEQLFEPFVTAKSDGVGLGLSVASDVARRHGGRIHWQRVNGMTRFTVELPASRCREPSGTSGVDAVSGPHRLDGPTVDDERPQKSGTAGRTYTQTAT
jgi:signal transduction histidine kinase